MAEDGMVLTGARVRALERRKPDDEACGEVETAHPGHPGSRDTFHAGTLRGVGRVHRRTCVDAYRRVAHARLHTTGTPITAAGPLNDRVPPFHDGHGLPVPRIMTDRGTEYCGCVDGHDFRPFLAVNDTDRTKTRVKSPRTDGIRGRFHKTVLQGFHQVAFRKKPYDGIGALRADPDEWLNHYSRERTHQGGMCRGGTPFQTMIEGKGIRTEKFLNQT